jgi:hypothetical protein
MKGRVDMGLFGEIKGKTGSNTGRYAKPGQYVARIDRVFVKTSQKGNGKIYVIVEWTALWSNVEGITAGMKRSWAVHMNGEWPDLALGNVADFIFAAYSSMCEAVGAPAPERDDVVNDENVETNVTGEANELGGAVLALECVQIETKKNTEFTRHDWSVPADLGKWLEAAKAA